MACLSENSIRKGLHILLANTKSYLTVQGVGVKSQGIMSVKIELLGYAKIMLHCSKYPYAVVGGFMLGDVSTKHISDVIPVFHGAPLANILELGAELTESSNKKIIGVYFCNERLDDTSVPGFVDNIVKTIESNVGQGNCIVGQIIQSAMHDKSKLCLAVSKIIMNEIF